jgi:hypothetical protein
MLVCFHAGAMKDQLLFVKIVLFEEQKLFNQINGLPFYQGKWPLKKLMRKNEGNSLAQEKDCLLLFTKHQK